MVDRGGAAEGEKGDKKELPYRGWNIEDVLTTQLLTRLIISNPKEAPPL
jgi:hypothetical protein